MLSARLFSATGEQGWAQLNSVYRDESNRFEQLGRTRPLSAGPTRGRGDGGAPTVSMAR